MQDIVVGFVYKSDEREKINDERWKIRERKAKKFGFRVELHHFLLKKTKVNLQLKNNMF